MACPCAKECAAWEAIQKDFMKADHGLTLIGVATLYGIVFGHSAAKHLPFEDYLSHPTRLKLMC